MQNIQCCKEENYKAENSFIPLQKRFGSNFGAFFYYLCPFLSNLV